jgi:hypothetical protein
MAQGGSRCLKGASAATRNFRECSSRWWPRQVDASRLAELKEVVASALGEARSSGASQAEADVSLQRGLTVTVRLGEVDTIEYHRDRGLSVTVYFGKSKGSASTADLRPAAVHETVVKAAAIAQHTAADACAGLADPQALAREIPDLDLYHPGTSSRSRRSSWRASARPPVSPAIRG